MFFIICENCGEVPREEVEVREEYYDGDWQDYHVKCDGKVSVV